MCKISVLVPVFNAEKYLEECLNSIIKQTLSDIEIICLNDGSTDGSAQILEKYASKDSRFRIINKANTGYGNTINIGIQEAKGKYISIVESDDYIEKNMYDVLWKTAEKYDLDFVKGDYAYFIGEIQNRTFDKIMICPRLLWYYKIFCPASTPKLLDVDMMNVTGIYRRSFLLRNHITLQESPGAAFQDTGLWFQIFFYAERCMFLPYAFYKIRRDNPNSSVMRPERFLAIYSEYEQIEKYLSEESEKNNRYAKYLFKRKIFTYLFILSKTDIAKQHSIITRLALDIQRAERSGTYDPKLFGSAMNLFLKNSKDWTSNQPLPAYRPSENPVIRLWECIYEHGLAYTLRLIFIKTGFRKKIF